MAELLVIAKDDPSKHPTFEDEDVLAETPTAYRRSFLGTTFMADYHILDGATDGSSYRVAHHIPIPEVTNDAGNSYRTLIATHEDTQSVVPDIAVGEQTKLTNGELVEHIETFNTHKSETSSSNKARLDARHTELVSIVQNDMQEKYRFFGFSANVS